ncbi:MAG: DNA-binding response regulator [Elusimicrobia bacterium HGW-Elusimicrobia-3]|jgi:DNA-binding response OmpR family regulator|nr:MAG: DNA-binding response regulator [Elusimicrobia bacterium HGW-Elusimicrobia-3]
MRKILVLIIEDDPACCELLTAAMLEAGRVVHAATTLAEGYKELEKARPDLIVLDRGLPDGDGVKFCLTLRKDSRYRTIPILMLTGRGEVEDRILGLRLGADDYMVKPFDMEELLARMDGLVRRNQPELAGGSGRMQFKGIVMDLRGRQVLANGEEIKVSPREYELLRIFLENRPYIRCLNGRRDL